jgi:GNAT superfamily N-acetyltransferase
MNRRTSQLTYRLAENADCDLLGRLNHELIADEGHRNPMSPAELAERMRGWLAGEYTAVLFELDGSVVAYALFCARPGDEIYLRQMFVARDHRRRGIGRCALDVLRDQIWPKDKRLVVDVLCRNRPAIEFWRSVGFGDYALTLELLPQTAKQ